MYLGNMILDLFVIAHGKDNCQKYLSVFEGGIEQGTNHFRWCFKKSVLFLFATRKALLGHSPQSWKTLEERVDSIR